MTTTPTEYAAPQHVAPTAAPVLPPAPRLLSIEETVDSLTGWDEFAIEKAFGAGQESLPWIKRLRALAFITLKRRDGLDDKAAKQRVMDLPQAALVDLFDTVGTDPETGEVTDPESEAGKASS